MVLKLLAAGALAVASRRRNSVENQVGRSFLPGSIDDMELAPAPIEPSWIIAGDPQARLCEHSKSADGASVTALWDCTAGTFRWYFGWDETVVILEGEVHVTAEDGSEKVLRTGDIAYFTAGSWATWHVENYVRKVAFVRKPFPGLMVAAMKLRQALKGPLAGAGLTA